MVSFWAGFEKRAFLLRGVKNVGRGISRMGNQLSARPDAGWVSKNVGAGLRGVGGLIRKNPVATTAVGAGALGAGGMKMIS